MHLKSSRSLGSRRSSLPKSAHRHRSLQRRRSDESSLDSQQMDIRTLHVFVRNTFGSGKTGAQNNFLDALEEIGGCSLHMFIIAIFTMWYMAVVLIHWFTAQSTNVLQLRCAIPDLENFFTFQEILNISLKQKEPLVRNKEVLQYCKHDVRNYADLVKKHSYNYDDIMKEIENDRSNPLQAPCDIYVININRDIEKNPSFQSIRMEFKLYCEEDKWNKMMFGFWTYGCLVSNLIFGIVADIYGRKTVLIITSMVHFVGFVIFAIPSKWCLIIGKFLTGFDSVAQVALYVIFLEMCDKTYVVWFGLLLYINSPIATFICCLFRKYFYYWRDTHLSNMTMFLLWPLMICYVTESPRWLMFINNRSKAWKVLQENNCTIEPDPSDLDEPDEPRPTVTGIFKQLTQQIYGNRFLTCSVLYFVEGVSMYIEKYQFINVTQFRTQTFYFIMAGVEVFLVLIGGVCSVKFGRREVLFTMYCLLAFFDVIIFMANQAYTGIESNVVRILLNTHLAISQIIFRFLWFYIIELFPTPIRMTALGLCRTFYELSYVLQHHLPFIFHPEQSEIAYMPACIATFSCTLIIGFLPKTKNIGLPDTFRDALYLKMGRTIST